MPRPKQRTPELRKHILAAALDGLGRDGLDGLTTRAVAASAGTSVPAIYELFGDKNGLVRALSAAGFRQLRRTYDSLELPGDSVADLQATALAFRAFATDNPALFAIMFTQPFAGLAPSADDIRAADATRRFVIERVQPAIDDGYLGGDATDLAHAMFAMMIGLAVQENGGWLGRSAAARTRRWQTAVGAFVTDTRR